MMGREVGRRSRRKAKGDTHTLIIRGGEEEEEGEEEGRAKKGLKVWRGAVSPTTTPQDGCQRQNNSGSSGIMSPTATDESNIS